MRITARQAHVLANLDRVIPLYGKYGSARPRYQLDGKECTQQIVGLGVRKLISKHMTGFIRRRSPETEPVRVAERQKPLADSIEQIRASLYSPGSVRTIGSKATRRLASPASAARP